MKLWSYGLVLLFCAIFGCGHENIENVSSGKMVEEVFPVTRDSAYLTVPHVRKMQQYLYEHGRKEQVNISSMIGKPMYVTYSTIDYKGISLSVDGTDRIYFTKGTDHVGNILVTPEQMVIVEARDDGNPGLTFRTYVEVMRKYVDK